MRYIDDLFLSDFIDIEQVKMILEYNHFPAMGKEKELVETLLYQSPIPLNQYLGYFLRLNEMKQVCRLIGLPVSGTKDILTNRILTNLPFANPERLEIATIDDLFTTKYLELDLMRYTVEKLDLPLSDDISTLAETLLYKSGIPIQDYIGFLFGVRELKNICRKIGLPVSGTKDVLVERVISNLSFAHPEKVKFSTIDDLLASKFIDSEYLTSLLTYYELPLFEDKSLIVNYLLYESRVPIKELLYLMFGKSKLKEICQYLNLPSTGQREILIDRIIEHLPYTYPERIEILYIDDLFSSKYVDLEVLQELVFIFDLNQSENRSELIYEILYQSGVLVQEYLEFLFKNEELRNICRDLGLHLSGRKDQLVERIISNLSLAYPEEIELKSLDQLLISTEYTDIESLKYVLTESGLDSSGSQSELVNRLLYEYEIPIQDYFNLLLNIEEMKNICRNLGLRVSGNKAALEERILANLNYLYPENLKITTLDQLLNSDKYSETSNIWRYMDKMKLDTSGNKSQLVDILLYESGISPSEILTKLFTYNNLEYICRNNNFNASGNKQALINTLLDKLPFLNPDKTQISTIDHLIFTEITENKLRRLLEKMRMDSSGSKTALIEKLLYRTTIPMQEYLGSLFGVKNLQETCKKLNLPIYGNKETLIERVLDSLDLVNPEKAVITQIKKILKSEFDKKKTMTKRDIIKEFNLSIKEAETCIDILNSDINYKQEEVQFLEFQALEIIKNYNEISLYNFVYEMDFGIDKAKKIGKFLVDKKIYDKFLRFPQKHGMNIMEGKKTQSIKKDEFIVFLSYSTKDSELFKIAEIAKKLKFYPEIDETKFWEKDSGINVVKYMEDNLGRSNIFLLFCSQNSRKSKAVEAEWQSAFSLMLKDILQVIPVYQNDEFIPILLGRQIRVKFKEDDIDGTIQEIYNEILRYYMRKKA